MTRDDLIRAVCTECDVTDEAWADEALRSTLEAIAPALAEPSWLAERLPPEQRAAVTSAERDPEACHASIVSRLAHAEGMPGVRAREQIQAVTRALGTLLDVEERQNLREQLPLDARDLFPEPRPHRAPDVQHLPPQRAHHHLSDARPGSSHPLSEAQARAAHTHSLAASADPHADTKLSSAHEPVHDAEKPLARR